MTAPIRWRDDTGWEYRCDDCAGRRREAFWPLTDEFWVKERGMARCRACFASLDARRARERYRTSKTVAERKREAARRYHHHNRAAEHTKARLRWEALVSDPERHAQYLERRRQAKAA